VVTNRAGVRIVQDKAAVKAVVTISKPDIQVYSATLRICARFSGLRYSMRLLIGRYMQILNLMSYDWQYFA